MTQLPPGAPGPGPGAGPAGSSGRISRRKFLQGTAAAGVGGLVVGGAGGYLIGDSSSSSASASATTTSGSKQPLVIGSGVPVTGLYSGDGQQMLRGQQLAVAEINASGGVLGRPLHLSVLDTQEQQPDVMRSVMQKFVTDNVAAIFAPFLTYNNAELPVVKDAGVPMFHVNTWHGNPDWVKRNGATNIFQGDPSETWYGSGFITVVNRLIASKAWAPSAKTMAIVTSNDPYSLNIAMSFRSGMEPLGWTATMFQEFSAPQADWGAVLVNIRSHPPGIVFFSDYAAGDEAAFIKQFSQSPTKSLVYQQYAPSIPQYLTLAGSAANGVLWSTVVGVLQDERAKAFDAKFQAQFGASPGFSNAGDQYDLVHFWAQSAAVAGNAYDWARVNAIVKASVYRGVCGAYSFPDDYLTCYPYPDYTADPSLGMPHLTFQIQNGQQVLIDPEPYTTGKFVLPSWL